MTGRANRGVPCVLACLPALVFTLNAGGRALAASQARSQSVRHGDNRECREGVACFVDDIYGHDRALDAALDQGCPHPVGW